MPAIVKERHETISLRSYCFSEWPVYNGRSGRAMDLTGIKYDDYGQRFQQRIAELTPSAKKLKVLDLSRLGMNWGYGGDLYQKELAPFLHVQTILLHGNYIDGMVINLARFENLEHLDLHFNAYWYWGTYGQLDLAKELPCPKLESLDLSDNMIGVVRLRKTPFRDTLLRLDLSGCYFHTPQQDGREHPVLRLDRFTRLRRLFLRDNKLPHVPKLFYLPTLEELDLSHNPLRCGHDQLRTLPRLKRLHLSANGLRRVPSALYEMRSLEYLDLRGNHVPAFEVKRLQRSLPRTRIDFDVAAAT